MVKAINKRIEGTDLFVFNYNSENGLYTYSIPFSADEAGKLFAETNRAIGRYGNVDSLQGLKAENGQFAQ